MDLLKVPSNQSLIDSDIGSVDSFNLLDIEELNDEEYGMPPVTELPSLESVLASADGADEWELGPVENSALDSHNPTPSPTPRKPTSENTYEGCSLLKYVFLQGVSQQITTASERIGAGTGSAVAAWGERIAVGTSHGLVMAFAAQALRWCSQEHKDQASVTSMDYNEDGTRLLAGFARGLVVMYESFEGTILRTVEACGGGPWGVLKVCWCSSGMLANSMTSAVVADTGGSVWLLRFTRILGVRGTKVSCLFSGARGEVCCVDPLPGPPPGWGCVLALATLSRVVVVCVGGGGGGGGASLPGPSHTLPLLAWQPAHRTDPVLCSARGSLIQFHQIRWGSGGLEALSLKRAALQFSLTAIRWLGARRLALVDSKETLHLWDVSTATTLETLDLADAQLVYANAYFKGVATGGKVSEALAIAGGSALGGACVGGGVSGALLLLGRSGLRRVAARAAHAAAHHHADMGRWMQAIKTLANEYKSLDGRSSRHSVSKHRADALLTRLASDPLHLGDFSTALAAVDLCIQMNLFDTLWNVLWEAACTVGLESLGLVPALAQRAAQGSLHAIPPMAAQMIVNVLAQNEPMDLQRALMHMPIECLDLHQVLSECRRLYLWQAWIRVTAGAFKDPPLPIKELLPLVGALCRGESSLSHHQTVDGRSPCPGDALLVYVADCLAGRDYPKGLLPIQDRPGVRHEVLGCLLFEGDDPSCPLPHLRALLLHDMGSTLRMFGMAYAEPPFMGPMGKLNRLKMTQALHNVMQTAVDPLLFMEDEIASLILFTANQLAAGSLPYDVHLINNLKQYFSKPSTSREANKLIESSWLSLLTCINNISAHFSHNEMLQMAENTRRLKVKRFLMERDSKFDGILETFLNDSDSESDMFLYLDKHASNPDRLISKQVSENSEILASKWPKHTAKLLVEHLPDLIPQVLSSIISDKEALLFSEELYKLEVLDSQTSVKHLELLCKYRPDNVIEYLNNAPNTLLPESALNVVRENDIKIAEPICLERSGDLSGALKSAIQLMLGGKCKEERSAFAEEACALCTRAAKVSSHVEAESLWKELIEGVAKLPEAPSAPLPALLLEGAANYLPLPWLVSQLCEGGGHAGALKGALASLLEAARGGAEVAKAAARLTGRELHCALASSLRGRRILPVSNTACCLCYKQLHLQPLVRAYSCGHAFHLECDPISGRCSRCGKSAVEVKLTKKIPNPHVTKSERSQNFQLCVVAPPRPDLEGVL